MSRSSWLWALFACLILLPSAYSIGVSFSAQDGGGSVSINSVYNLDDNVSASESSSASFGPVGISDTRSVSGTGKTKTYQSYSGSGGYRGKSSFSAVGSGFLTGSASLAPGSMNAFQSTSATGDFAETSLGLNDMNGSAGTRFAMSGGNMVSTQEISTGSVHASGGLHASADSIQVSAYGTVRTRAV
jgi:hypothetical protein